MRSYTVTLYRDSRESAWIEVNATSATEAIDKALDIAADGELDYEPTYSVEDPDFIEAVETNPDPEAVPDCAERSEEAETYAKLDAAAAMLAALGEMVGRYSRHIHDEDQKKVLAVIAQAEAAGIKVEG